MTYGISIKDESAWGALPNQENTQQHGSFSGLGFKQEDTSRKTTNKNKIIGSCKQLKEYNIMDLVCSEIYSFFHYDKTKPLLKLIPRIAQHRRNEDLNLRENENLNLRESEDLNLRENEDLNLRENEDLNLRENIGEGATAQVFSGTHNGKNVVIKKISKKSVSYKDVKEEVTTLFSVQKNPYFVTIITAFQDKDHYYILMKDEGRDLALMLEDALKKSQPSETMKKVGYAIVEITNCLKGLIQTHVYCGDLKINNMVYTDSNVKICDLGFNEGKGAHIVNCPTKRFIEKSICLHEGSIYSIFSDILDKQDIKYDNSVLLKKYTEEEQKERFEIYLKPELDKNNLVTKKHQQKIKQLFYKATVNKYLVQRFVQRTYEDLDSDGVFAKMPYDDVASIMTSIINGWQNLIKDELGYVKLTDNLGDADTK